MVDMDIMDMDMVDIDMADMGMAEMEKSTGPFSWYWGRVMC